MCFVQIKVDENGKIVDAKFKTFGCGSAIASSSLATEWVKGKFVSVAFFCVFVHVLKVTCIVKHCVLQNFPLLTFSFRETLTVSLFFYNFLRNNHPESACACSIQCNVAVLIIRSLFCKVFKSFLVISEKSVNNTCK